MSQDQASLLTPLIPKKIGDAAFVMPQSFGTKYL